MRSGTKSRVFSETRNQPEGGVVRDGSPSSGSDGIPRPDDYVANGSSAESTLALYQSLFRGRDDVFAIRWQRLDGRTGYSPALRPGAPRGRNVKHEPHDYPTIFHWVPRSSEVT